MTAIHLERILLMISDCIARSEWAPNASMLNHPLQCEIVEHDGEIVIRAAQFGVEIHAKPLKGIRHSRRTFVLVTQYGGDRGNPETSTVDIEESIPMSAEMVAVAFTSLCFKRHLQAMFA